MKTLLFITTLILALTINAQTISESFIGATYYNAFSTDGNLNDREEDIFPLLGLRINQNFFETKKIAMKFTIRAWYDLQQTHSHAWIRTTLSGFHVDVGYLPTAIAQQHRPTPVSNDGNFEYWAQSAVMPGDGFGVSIRTTSTDHQVLTTYHKQGEYVNFGAGYETNQVFDKLALTGHIDLHEAGDDPKNYGLASTIKEGSIEATAYGYYREGKYHYSAYCWYKFDNGITPFADYVSELEFIEIGLSKTFKETIAGTGLDINYMPAISYRNSKLDGHVDDQIFLYLQVFLTTTKKERKSKRHEMPQSIQ